MTEKQSFEISVNKQKILDRDNWACQVCGKLASQIAHRICQSKSNLLKYGKHVIHHRLNLVSVCGLKCNAKVNIENKTSEKMKLIDRINIDIDNYGVETW